MIRPEVKFHKLDVDKRNAPFWKVECCYRGSSCFGYGYSKTEALSDVRATWALHFGGDLFPAKKVTPEWIFSEITIYPKGGGTMIVHKVEHVATGLTAFHPIKKVALSKVYTLAELNGMKLDLPNLT